MTRYYDIFLTKDDIEEIQWGGIVKRFAGSYIIHIQKQKIEEVK